MVRHFSLSAPIALTAAASTGWGSTKPGGNCPAGVRWARGDPPVSATRPRTTHSVLAKVPPSLEDGDWVERRSRAALDRQRRERQHELIAVQAPGRLNGLLEVQVLDDAHAEPVEPGLETRQREGVPGPTPAGARPP